MSDRVVQLMPRKQLHCSFCGQGEADVQHIITGCSEKGGPGQICDECVYFCVAILQKEGKLDQDRIAEARDGVAPKLKPPS